MSCKSAQQIQYINKTDSVYIENTIRDSIFINQYKKEDTIFIVKEKFTIQTQYKDRIVKDTIQTTKYINRTQKVKQKGWKGYLWGFGTALFLMIGLFIYKRFR